MTARDGEKTARDGVDMVKDGKEKTTRDSEGKRGKARDGQMIA